MQVTNLGVKRFWEHGIFRVDKKLRKSSYALDNCSEKESPGQNLSSHSIALGLQFTQYRGSGDMVVYNCKIQFQKNNITIDETQSASISAIKQTKIEDVHRAPAHHARMESNDGNQRTYAAAPFICIISKCAHKKMIIKHLPLPKKQNFLMQHKTLGLWGHCFAMKVAAVVYSVFQTCDWGSTK